MSLVNTGVAAGNGGLTVTGTGTAGSGDAILRKTGADGLLTEGHAYVLVGTKEPSLNWVQLDELSNTAVVGQNVLGLTITNSSMAGAGTTAGIDENCLDLRHRWVRWNQRCNGLGCSHQRRGHGLS